MHQQKLTIESVPGDYSVVRLSPHAPIPPELVRPAGPSGFITITRTDAELSIVCTSDQVPQGSRVEPGWSLFRIRGPLSFELTGILAALVKPLAVQEISVFTIATFDTDYLMFRARDRERALHALTEAGHRIADE